MYTPNVSYGAVFLSTFGPFPGLSAAFPMRAHIGPFFCALGLGFVNVGFVLTLEADNWSRQGELLQQAKRFHAKMNCKVS